MVNEQVRERIGRYKDRLAADPASGVFVPLAEMMGAEGDVEEALGVLEDGLSRHPGSIPGRVVLGRMLLATGRADLAREVLGEVLTVDGDNLVARRLLAEDCRSRGDWQGALPHLELLVGLEPDDSRWPAAMAEAKGRLAEGTAGGDVPDAGFATMTLVDIYTSQGYYDKAVAALRQMSEAEPEREDVAARLRRAEDALARQEAGTVAQPAPDTATSANRSDLRSQQKRQFADWITRISDQDGKAAP